MSQYHIMFCYFERGQRVDQVIDFKEGQLIRFTIDELEKDELPKELKEYIRGIQKDFEDGGWDYIQKASRNLKEGLNSY
jgi:hypothetical protein